MRLPGEFLASLLVYLLCIESNMLLSDGLHFFLSHLTIKENLIFILINEE